MLSFFALRLDSFLYLELISCKLFGRGKGLQYRIVINCVRRLVEISDTCVAIHRGVLVVPHH